MIVLVLNISIVRTGCSQGAPDPDTTELIIRLGSELGMRSDSQAQLVSEHFFPLICFFFCIFCFILVGLPLLLLFLVSGRIVIL